MQAHDCKYNLFRFNWCKLLEVNAHRIMSYYNNIHREIVKTYLQKCSDFHYTEAKKLYDENVKSKEDMMRQEHKQLQS